MYAHVLEIGGGFFEQVCAAGHLLPFCATHPHHASTRELTLGDVPWLPYQPGFMQDRGYGRLRTLWPGTRVNKGMRKGRGITPQPFSLPLPALERLRVWCCRWCLLRPHR